MTDVGMTDVEQLKQFATAIVVPSPPPLFTGLESVEAAHVVVWTARALLEQSVPAPFSFPSNFQMVMTQRVQVRIVPLQCRITFTPHFEHEPWSGNAVHIVLAQCCWTLFHFQTTETSLSTVCIVRITESQPSAWMFSTTATPPIVSTWWVDLVQKQLVRLPNSLDFYEYISLP